MIDSIGCVLPNWLYLYRNTNNDAEEDDDGEDNFDFFFEVLEDDLELLDDDDDDDVAISGVIAPLSFVSDAVASVSVDGEAEAVDAVCFPLICRTNWFTKLVLPTPGFPWRWTKTEEPL